MRLYLFQFGHLRLQSTSAASDSLLGIINDILDFSKIEAGQIILERIPFNLSEIVKETADVFTHAAQNKGLRLDVDIPADMPRHVGGDPLRVRQVLTNLIGNAVKFTEEGSVQVEAKMMGRENGKIQLCFSVTDTGIGMTSQQTRSIFDMFSQADTSTTRKYGGTGLGLSITERLVELMGGKIEVESEEGKGSTFSFYATFSEVEEQPVAQIVTTPEGVPDLTGMRVLLVEDNKINQDVARETLEQFGVKVSIAGNGREALDKLNAESFDLVLMDIQMPVLGGYEATRLIRADGRFADLPIVAMTANAMTSDRAKSIEAGMNEHLSKPVKPHELFAALVDWGNPAKPASAESTHAMPAIHGINTELGLEHIGTAEMYKKTLVKFAATYVEFIKEVMDAYESGDHETAHRKVHSLKSVAGMIGAEELRVNALALETALREAEPESVVLEKSEALKLSLKTLISSIRAAKLELIA